MRKRRAQKANADAGPDIELGDVDSPTRRRNADSTFAEPESSPSKPKVQPIITDFSPPSVKRLVNVDAWLRGSKGGNGKAGDSRERRPDVDYITIPKPDADAEPTAGAPMSLKEHSSPKKTGGVTNTEFASPYSIEVSGFHCDVEEEDSNCYSPPFADSTPRHSWMSRVTRRAQRYHQQNKSTTNPKSWLKTDGRRTLTRKSTASIASDNDKICKLQQPRQTSFIYSTKIVPESFIIEQAKHAQNADALQPRIVTNPKPKNENVPDRMVDVEI